MPRRSPPPPRRTARGGWRPWLIAFATALVYANNVSGPFLFDDAASIIENPAIRSFSTVTSERFNSPLSGRPVVGLTFALNYALGGLAVEGYHATNIAIHLCSALLLLGLVRRTLMLPRLRDQYGARAGDLATAAALVWTVHPLNTEAVNYLTQRTELVYASLFLLTLYAVARSHLSNRTWPWHIVAVTACALGMASKESMVTAPLVVLLYERVFVVDSWGALFDTRPRAYFHAALALTWVVLLFLVLPGPRASSAGFATDVTVWTYLLNQATVIARYLRLAVWPNGLVVNYGPPVPLTLGSVLPQALVIVSLLVATGAALWRRPFLGFLGAWLFVTLAPTSSFLPIATEVGAERRMYLPLVAIVAAGVIGPYSLAAVRRRVEARGAWMLVGAVVLLMGTATVARNGEYASTLTIAEQDLRRRPNDYTHGAVGSELARLRRDEEAIVELRIAARSDPRSRYNLGVSLFNTRRYDDAIRELEGLAAEHPMREEVPWARRIIGHAYGLQGRWLQAITQFRMVLAMTPHDAEARRLYAEALNSYGIERGTAGEHAKAVDAFRASLAQEPHAADVRYNLATALLDSGDVTGAAEEVRRALQQGPTDADSYNLLGRVLAMQEQFSDALVNLEAAVKLRPDDQALRDDLERLRRFLQR